MVPDELIGVRGLAMTDGNQEHGVCHLFVMVPGQLLGVHVLATTAGASSHIFIPNASTQGPPHPVLSRSTQRIPAMITIVSPPTELEARLHPALPTSCGAVLYGTSVKRWCGPLVVVF